MLKILDELPRLWERMASMSVWTTKKKKNEASSTNFSPVNDILECGSSTQTTFIYSAHLYLGLTAADKLCLLLSLITPSLLSASPTDVTTHKSSYKHSQPTSLHTNIHNLLQHPLSSDTASYKKNFSALVFHSYLLYIIYVNLDFLFFFCFFVLCVFVWISLQKCFNHVLVSFLFLRL